MGVPTTSPRWAEPHTGVPLNTFRRTAFTDTVPLVFGPLQIVEIYFRIVFEIVRSFSVRIRLNLRSDLNFRKFVAFVWFWIRILKNV